MELGLKVLNGITCKLSLRESIKQVFFNLLLFCQSLLLIPFPLILCPFLVNQGRYAIIIVAWPRTHVLLDLLCSLEQVVLLLNSDLNQLVVPA